MSDATNARDASARLDRAVRRVVWTLWTVGMLVAAVIYAWKAADSRSAFVRWSHQVVEIDHGVDIWKQYYFPNPPILPLVLYPLMVLPPLVGAMIWFCLKVAMATWVAMALVRMAQGPKLKPMDGLSIGLVLLLSLRPILSDLQHGNINIYILFLIVACLMLWRSGRDLRAGVVLGLAIATKVTPALFVPYFLYKRAWKTVAGCMLGLVLFLFVVPGAILGPAFNWQCLMSWRHNIISPFVQGDTIKSTQEVNQSMVGVLTRLFTQTRELGPHGNGGTMLDLNILSLNPTTVALVVKGLSIGLVLLLALFCQTRAKRRDDPRLLGEFALVVLTMLFVSERSWKHHYVTIIIPLTYLVFRLGSTLLTPKIRWIIGGGLALFALLMLTTSEEVGRNFFNGEGHEVALFFGLYLWSGVVLYVVTAWRVWTEREGGTFALGADGPSPEVEHQGPHWARKPHPNMLENLDGAVD